MKVLTTGGAGYIGSHTCVQLLEAGHEVVVVDNLSNSKALVIDRIEKISGKTVTFYKVDLLDYNELDKIFQSEDIDAVIHFAGYKAVGESVDFPLKYYHNNLTGSFNLCNLMLKYKVNNLVFSSSATVYGDPHKVPITEDFPLHATNPYGRTKLMLEQIFRDIQSAHPQLNIALLRYFNPIGAHPSGLIGEDPNDIPNNLLPYIAQVATGKLKQLSVFGNDYPTKDGTGVRDYIHVVDLSNGHLKALDKLSENPGIVTYNLGTGTGYSVLEMIAAFEKASGQKVNYRITERRPGDIATCFADPGKAENELGWKAKYGIDEMCEHTWNWQKNIV
jgi:UDP-glucose 4-epimerase